MSANIGFKSINKLAIPALIAGIAEPLLSITDTAIIGNINENGTESLAAVGIVGAFISMLIWVFGQIRSAISSIISQYLGANKLDEIKEENSFEKFQIYAEDHVKKPNKNSMVLKSLADRKHFVVQTTKRKGWG